MWSVVEHIQFNISEEARDGGTGKAMRQARSPFAYLTQRATHRAADPSRSAAWVAQGFWLNRSLHRRVRQPERYRSALVCGWNHLDGKSPLGPFAISDVPCRTSDWIAFKAIDGYS